ncbi:hypothetical protein LPJ57_002244 [Coemansia sp. RSA 486]|nr:hypothetical protein LPJ57_002244 [Coemansia sp. RSA 486]KAJ2237220.1 hypothetical protein IWW45_001157 [Coemansia sp. RSA 485]KAJ2596437.1 hypothetical protein GGF39_003450 [Coemansia sp. RSA 1721]
MGRAPKRTFKDRANPLVTSAVPDIATQVTSKEEVPALLKKLNSGDANDRVWAAASASNLLLSEDPKVRRMLLANNIVSALIERMSDSVPDVVIQATGALHNLAAADQGAAEEINRKNIYASIQQLIPRLAKSIDDIIKDNDEGKKLDVNDRKSVFLTTDNLISILWVLCETVPASLKQINSMALFPFLISFFNVIGRLPSSLIQTAGQFLYTLTDENTPAKRALISHPNAIQTLMKTVATQHIGETVTSEDSSVIRILAGGILSNIKPAVVSQLEKTYRTRPGGIPEEEIKPWEDLSRTLVQVISEYISFDVHAAAKHAAASIKAVISARAEATANGLESLPGTKHESELDSLNARISYVQLALELAANIFTDEGASESDSTLEQDAAVSDDRIDSGGLINGQCKTEDQDEDQEMADDDASEDEDVDDDDEDDMGYDSAALSDNGDDDANDFDADDMEQLLAEEGTTAQKTDDAVQHSILGVFITNIVPSLQRLAEPTTMSTLPTAIKECEVSDLSDSESIRLVASTVETFANLHDRALGCFNNVLLVIEDSVKSWFRMHSDSVASWWQFLIAVAEHLFGIENTPSELASTDQNLRFIVLEPAIGCMWTLARSASGNVPVTLQQIEGLIRVCEIAPTSDIRVKAVGVLGNIARRQPGHIEENKRIGQYLLESVITTPLMMSSNPTQALTYAAIEPIIEALDLFYDIYSDMEFDYDEPVFVQCGFLAKIRQLYQPAHKLSKRIDRRKNKGLRDRTDLAVQNLHAFIGYKASERKAK